MTQLTPEELAACREAYCKEYGYDPEWDVVIDEDFQKAFAAGLSHARAECAKEIAENRTRAEKHIAVLREALIGRRELIDRLEIELADLKAQIEKHSKTATPADYVVEQNKMLKAQVEGLRKLLEDIATADSEGKFVRWPHVFPPTHWMPLPEPPKS